MIYLASPYSHPSAEIVFDRIKKTEKALWALINSGELVWSPIIQFHGIATDYLLPTHADFWWNINRDFIRRCDEVLVLQLQDWEYSKGIAMEIEYARMSGIRINYITPRNGYARSPSPWIFTKHEDIMRADQELIKEAFNQEEFERNRMALTLADCKIKRK